METTKRRNNFTQSVDRAVTVMELLSRRGWSGVTEVANELGINKSTAYRLLNTLRDRGLVEQDAATEKYRLGFGLVMLASSVTADLDVARCSRPVCDWLAERTRETVTVACYPLPEQFEIFGLECGLVGYAHSAACHCGG